MKASLVGYFLGGYPGTDASLELCKKAVPDTDIFEIGYPASDPYLDGDVIKEAHERVMAQGTPDISWWRRLRSAVSKPLWLMAYKKDFVDSGRYREFAGQKLADCLVLPDCDDKERLAIREELAPSGTGVLGFVHAGTPPDQFALIAKRHRQVYFQLHLGKTGSGGVGGDPSPCLALAKTMPQVRVFAGFGIDTAEKSRRLAEQGFDGVIVGTALLKALNKSEQAMLELIRTIASALRDERR